MCLKDWFKKPEPFTYGNKLLIDFAINDYKGSDNDLRGCLNDQKKKVATFSNYWPDFKFRTFTDSECTRARLRDEVRAAFAAMPEGWLFIAYSGHGTYKKSSTEENGYSEAMYLYDGTFTDNEWVELMKEKPENLKVVFMLDCCFGEGVVSPRGNPTYIRYRFLSSEEMPPVFNVVRKITEESLSYICFAGSLENEPSADAYINNEFTGAHTFYFMRCIKPGEAFITWQKRLDLYLPNKDFKQTPVLLGNKELMQEILI